MQETVSQVELAEILGHHTENVRAWERQGMPVRSKGRRGVASDTRRGLHRMGD